MPVSTERKSPVSVLDFAYAPLTVDTKEQVTYGDVVNMGGVLISANYTPQMNNSTQYASGQQYDSYTSKGGGTLDVQTPGLNGTDQEGLLGSKVSKTTGLITSNKSDVVPFVMAIYSTETSDGKVNLYKFPKVKFSSSGENATTKESNGVTFQATTLNGAYAPLINTGDDMFCIKGLDPVTDAETISTWFATATGGTSLASS